MRNSLIIAVGISVLATVTGCAKYPPANSYTPACYTKTVRVWDEKQNKWVKTKKDICTLGNIY